MRVSGAFAVGLPIDQIDMYRWVTELTPEEYESFAGGHKAMGSGFRGGEFFMVNVELIGTDMLVQHYQLTEHDKSHVKFYSPRTRGYIYRWLPVTFGVPWEMTVRPTPAGTCELHCVIGVDFPSRLLAAAAWLNGLGFLFLRRHLAAEGAAFAASIERKFGPRQAPDDPAGPGAAAGSNRPRPSRSSATRSTPESALLIRPTSMRPVTPGRSPPARPKTEVERA